MTRTVRGAATTLAALVVMVAFEAVALRAGTAGIVIVALAAVLIVAVAAMQVDLMMVGVGAACGAAFTLSWNGWYVGPVRPGDILVFVALAALVGAAPNRAFRTPPWWVKVLVFTIIAVVVVQIYFPPSSLYLGQRTVLTAAGVPTVSTTKSLTLVNLGVAFKFIVAVAAVPLAFAGAVRADRRAARWLPLSFAVGTAISGWVALSDRLGTSISRLLTGLPNPGGTRQIGFSDHPNFLAPSLVLAFPFAYWLAFDADRRKRITGIACFPGLVGGVYASGSRGGAVAMVLVILLCVGIHPRTRLYIGNVLASAVALAGLTFVAFPSTLHSVLVATRLDNPVSTTGSDEVRTLLGAQGVRDFLHAPIAGIGLQVSDEAQQVYLQELASGGLVLFVAMAVYTVAAMFSAVRLMPRDHAAGAVLAALVGTVALNFAEADLTDRFYYVPVAILVAMLEHARLEREDEDEVPRLVVSEIPVPEPVA